ncbi:Hypothetical predicted protein [Mytilus galloprovincialis]|uniref:Uncharacterized protein n=1 Tax=Mytilus galloprovincialis TaxID=29158 RepID=A0A8B6EEM9_MYTGA|nr:Hypothetical predicted protein [Mytilus galloprovincialis]
MDRLSYKIVAVLDLGTTNSGFGFAFTSELGFRSDKLKVHVNQGWNDGRGNFLFKTPTCILLDKNKELEAFGYDAEDMFADLCIDAKQDKYYFFRGFYTNKNFTSDTMLIDETRKTLPAIHVFNLFIEAFANGLMEKLWKRSTNFVKGDIRWVIPVLAYLSDSEKQFLRSCVEKAGIHSNQLMLVTKAEAALLYCQHLPAQDHYQKLQDEIEYMVVQLGGCSADITILKKEANQVIEKYRTIGNDCGGTSVNNTVLQYIVNIFGPEVITSLKKEEPEQFLNLEREISIKIKTVGKGQIRRIRIPMYVLKICGDRDHGYKGTYDLYGKRIELVGDKLKIQNDMTNNFFQPTIDKIINLMENVFADYRDSHNVKEIVMVGGFAESILVQDAVRQNFPQKYIVIPDDPVIAVIKGAVLCGHQPCQFLHISSSKVR